jgi:hypothetical protein
VVIALAIFWSRMVFPVLGGDTMRALALADGAEEVDDPGGSFFGISFEIQFLVRIQGREILEGYAVLGNGWLVVVHQLDAQHGEETLALLGAADLPVNRVAGLEVEESNLGGGDIDIAVPER